ncbi:MAG: hypothetical protein V9G19_24600 [Tetrasphaera sp.]
MVVPAALTGNKARKLFGVSALLGVAATGIVLVRRERERHDYTPSEVRDRLRERYAEALAIQREAAAGVAGSE